MVAEVIRMGSKPYILDGERVSRHAYERAREDHFNLALPKGMLEQVKAHATARGESTRAFIRRAISEAMEQEGEKVKPPE